MPDSPISHSKFRLEQRSSAAERLVVLVGSLMLSAAAAGAASSVVQSNKTLNGERAHDAPAGSQTESASRRRDILSAIERSEQYIMDANWVRAAAELDPVIEAGPPNSRLFAMRSHLRQNAGDLPGALADAEQAVNIDGFYAKGYSTKGEVLMLMGRPQEALTNLSRAIDLAPNDSDIYDIRARLHACEGRTDEALADFDKVLLLAPKEDANTRFLVRRERIPLLVAKGNYETAVDDLNHLSNAKPTDAVFPANRGLLQAYLGSIPEGIRDCRRAVELDPSSVLALNNLAWLLAVVPDDRFRDGDEAIELATKACEITHWKTTFCLGTLAAAYAEKGDFTSAIKWQEEAIALGLSGKYLESAQKRLADYRENRPCRQVMSEDAIPGQGEAK